MTKRLKGIYLVIDPSMEKEALLRKLVEAADGGIDMLKIWNNWRDDCSKEAKLALIGDIVQIADPHGIPVLINEAWELLRDAPLDGVHFDQLPDNVQEINGMTGKKMIVGMTCGNDAKAIAQAKDNGVDYISFCSMFPSSSVDTCELVRPNSVLAARAQLDIPIFLSGGINPENVRNFHGMDFQGIAVISGIMNAPSIHEMIQQYKSALTQLGI